MKNRIRNNYKKLNLQNLIFIHKQKMIVRFKNQQLLLHSSISTKEEYSSILEEKYTYIINASLS
jgi:hypothetical protein